MKKTMLGLLSSLTLLVLCSGTMLGQGGRAHFPQVAVGNASGSQIRPLHPPGGQTIIYSNLGSPDDAYDASNGYFVSGQKNVFNAQKQDIAVPFTPTQNAVVLTVTLPLQYYGYGANGAVVGIYSDAGGLPGTRLAQKGLTNFDAFGSGCCNMATWNLSKGVAVEEGTQYWVVGTTNCRTKDSVNTWDFVWNDAAGTFAFQQDDGGWLLLTEGDGFPLPALAVYGTLQ